ncbi:hypothetical protein [Caldivirga maquilingensis]|uniref:hypothetical protein n=1 Tax=Caldivirga maquilingensis TaxID=76887 RepID=UPI0012E9AE02|nr:hypothetical protein [Caldivirga maquilingensis]
MNGRLLNRYGGFNEVAVQVLLGRLKVCRGSRRGLALVNTDDSPVLSDLGGSDVNCFIDYRCSEVIMHNAVMPEYPQFVIDVSHWRRHTEGELRSLIIQLIQALREVRRYLWDGNLTVTGIDSDFMELLRKFTGNINTAVRFLGSIPPSYLKSAVMLDPYGDVELTEGVIKSINVFIIGGISDSEVIRKGETLELYRDLGLSEFNIPRVRLTLRGVLTGVPERINKLVSILLMVKCSGYNLEDAIIANQSKADKINRLNRELSMLRIIDSNTVSNLLTWLGLTPWDNKVASVLRRRGLLHGDSF